MKIIKRSHLRFTMYFLLVSLMWGTTVFAKDEVYPPSPPPATKKAEDANKKPLTDRPPTAPPKKTGAEKAKMVPGARAKGTIKIFSPSE